MLLMILLNHFHLNTTNVSVQSIEDHIKHTSFINLNTTNVSVQFKFRDFLEGEQVGFKYNKCIGSMRDL